MASLPGVSDEVLARAALTQKQLTALRLYNPPARGYRSVALALDISRDGARYHVQTGLRKLEKAMRAEPVTVTSERAPQRAARDHEDEPADIRAFAH
jgi:hypothetical protein